MLFTIEELSGYTQTVILIIGTILNRTNSIIPINFYSRFDCILVKPLLSLKKPSQAQCNSVENTVMCMVLL